MSALKYWIWLSAADVSADARAAVLLHYGDAERAFFSAPGDFKNIERLTRREAELLEKRDLCLVNPILEKCEMLGLKVISFQDASYPRRLRNIYSPPVALYVKGRLPAIDENAVIAVVGTRNASPYGIKMSRQIACDIARCGGIVASGLTRGIDAAAAEGALYGGGTVIGVLGTCHSAAAGSLAEEVAARGALISEYPPLTPDRKTHFRERNRITAGISLGVVAVEAPEGSNTRLFVAEAADQGKEIFAVPGNADAVNSVETNTMIKDGAHTVTCGWEVLEEFEGLYPEKIRKTVGSAPLEAFDLPRCAAPQKNYSAPEKQKPTKKEVDKPKNTGYIDLQEQLKALNEDQLAIITAIEKDASHIDDIIERTGLSTARVLSQLTILEIKGYIRREAGKRILLNIAKK